jgi:uncharacterized protein YdaU (DUF1376 family)
MGIFKWYKRDPQAALVGMTLLTLEERGAYNTLLDLLYMHDGSLPDDATLICKWLRTNDRRWKRLRIALIKHKKIYVLAGFIRNDRTDREIRYANLKAAEKARQRIRPVK